MIKTKAFTLTRLEYYIMILKLLKLKLVLYTLLAGFIFCLKVSLGENLNTFDIVFITFFLTMAYLPLISSISIVTSSNNSTFFQPREIEIKDQFYFESREDGSFTKENLSQFKFIKESSKFYYLFNSELTFYPIKKDSFISPEDHDRFKVQIIDKFKKNGFIEL